MWVSPRQYHSLRVSEGTSDEVTFGQCPNTVSFPQRYSACPDELEAISLYEFYQWFDVKGVRATAPQLIRYTRGPGRSLDYCMSQWYSNQRGHKPELTAGRYAPKGGSPMESPHNQHLRLKEKGDI